MGCPCVPEALIAAGLSRSPEALLSLIMLLGNVVRLQGQ